MSEFLNARLRFFGRRATLILLGSSFAIGLGHAGDFEVRNEVEFKKIVSPAAKLEKLATDMKFTEGPVWLAREPRSIKCCSWPAAQNEFDRLLTHAPRAN